MALLNSIRAVTKALIEGGEDSYIRVLPDEFLLKSVVIRVDFKRNSSGRTRIYEYAPPPPINALVTALNSIGLHWAFMKIHELGTKGYLKSLADKILNGA